jgi:phosphatidylethanolamine-binding protein (PEBP) family uncharacterized protein
MNARTLLPSLTALAVIAATHPARAHLIGDEAHDHATPKYDFSVKPPMSVALRNQDGSNPVRLLAAARTENPRLATADKAAASSAGGGSLASRVASIFAPFAPKVKTRADEKFVYVESDSMPDHDMMVGITAWQQQVPIPQPYSGDNAWRIPLYPVVAKNPLSAKSHFFRGAIALAANGVPIFNPIKNDGRTDTFLAGELDQFGGHCGRADDYHYHIAPTHLQKLVGPDKPVAYALDGYAIFGFNEPDGSAPGKLDEFNGHTTPALGYHYHATKTYPYLNGGFHGEVVEAGGQVDPQPRTGGVRPALPPWRGAKISGFTSEQNKKFSVKVQVGAETHYVNYALNTDGSVKFDFVDAKGQVKTETYSPRTRGGGDPKGKGGQKKGDGKGKGSEPKGGSGGARPEGDRGDGRPPSDRADARPAGNAAPAATPLIINAKRSGNFVLTSPAVKDGQELPKEFNGDGEGATLPLNWKGAPAGTKSYALVMDHLAKGPEMKCYWTMWDIPPTVTSLPKNVQGVGKLGSTWKRGETYITPHSAGGGPKTYTLHVYALSKTPQFNQPANEVTREVLLASIKDSILDSAELKVVYTPSSRGENSAPGGKDGQKKGERK